MGSKAKELAKLLSGSGQGGTIAPALVSDQQNTSTGLFSLPAGTSAERPGTSYNGSLRYNTEFNRLEQFTPDGWAAIDTPPTIETLAYAGDDLAADTAGGTVITLTGQNFQDSFAVTVGGTLAATVTYISATQVTFVAPAKSSGDYDVILQNANGLTASLQSGISYSGTPTFSTAAALGEYSPETTIPTITIVASDSDGGAISYTVTSGALPTGLTLNADGTVTGTTPSVTGTETSYFTVEAVDDENQSNTRTFNIVVLRPIYAYPIPQSLMFNDDDSAYLYYTPTTSGNQKKWTFSAWVKRANLGTQQGIFSGSSYSGNDGIAALYFYSDDTLHIYYDTSGTNPVGAIGPRVYRDTSAWYHIVWAVDAANTEHKIWVNNQLVSTDTGKYPPNFDYGMNRSGSAMGIGVKVWNPDSYFDGYMAEVNYCDGQYLTPDSFAETYKDVYVPKDYTGPYGANGFHLPMTNDTSVEAFNAVLWKGNSPQSQSITGVGFAPDLVWVKARAQNYSYELHDTVRGPTKQLFSDTPAAEDTDANSIKSFDSDGFTVGSGGAINDGGSTSTFVAWCWDAGDNSDKTYAVTVVSDSGNKYRFDGYGTSAVTLELAEGSTYRFDQSDSSNSGHPLRFSTTSDGTHGGGSEYTTGVTTNGTAGSAGAYTEITVASGAPTLYYYCTVHSGMGGQADTNTTEGASNFDGSIQSVVKANPTYGFSIVSYEGSGANATVGHGLGASPSMFIVKNRDSGTTPWLVWHKDLATPATQWLKLDTTDSVFTNGDAFGTAPTSSVITVNTFSSTNGSGNKMIAYCWAEKAGYSKFGSYLGSSGDPSITTGFKPAFLLIKRTDASGNSWNIWDNTRDTDGDGNLDLTLFPNLNNAEDISSYTDYIQFTDTGFVVKGNGAFVNGGTSSYEYIYAAFADKRDSAFWRDESGNDNDWQPINTGAYRITTDTPTE